MSHTRGRDKNNPGKFAYECFDWNNNLFRAEGGFDTAADADRAAERAERDAMALAYNFNVDIYPMSDDDLLRELGC